MIKRYPLFALVFLAIFWSCCEEVPPPINIGGGAEMSVDTTYVLATSPAAQAKGILIEDLTGVRCVNCPQAAQRAKGLKASNPDQVVVVGVYTEQPNNLTFPHAGTEDLRTEEATNLYTNIYGSPNLPGGGVNRKVFSGQSQINQLSDFWASSVNTELPLKAVLNMDTLAMNRYGDTAVDISMAFTFNESYEDRVFVSIMLLENEIEAAQTTLSGVDEGYVHEHVLRKMYTPYNGAPFYSNAEKGRYIEASWTLKIPDHVDLDHSAIVVIVNLNEADKKEVLHCKEYAL